MIIVMINPRQSMKNYYTNIWKTISCALTLVLSCTPVISSFAKNPTKTVKAKDSSINKQFNGMIESFLMENPEVIIKAVHKYQAQQEMKQKTEAKNYMKENAKTLFSAKLDGKIGSPKASTTLLVIHDYQCGYCRKAADSLNKAMATNKNVKLIVKQLPILGQDSVFAAKAAMLAQDLGKFASANKELIKMQKPMSKEKISKAFAAIGISKDKLEAAWTSDKYEKAVQSNFKEAQKLGVQGTPVIIIANKDYTKVDFITNFMDEQKFIQIINNH